MSLTASTFMLKDAAGVKGEIAHAVRISAK